MRIKLKNISLLRDCRGLKRAGHLGGESAFMLSFWEVLISIVIVALVFGTIINGYLAGAVKVQWSGYSLAAESIAIQTLEQARSATWDIASGTVQITNMSLNNKQFTNYANGTWIMTGYTTNVMDIPWKGTNFIVATNFVTAQVIFANGQTNPWVQLQMIRVDTVWPFNGWRRFTWTTYTNTVCTYMAPDNRDPSTLGVSP